eukprot:6440052-Pyramimonas_sp.AAC.1
MAGWRFCPGLPLRCLSEYLQHPRNTRCGDNGRFARQPSIIQEIVKFMMYKFSSCGSGARIDVIFGKSSQISKVDAGPRGGASSSTPRAPCPPGERGPTPSPEICTDPG